MSLFNRLIINAASIYAARVFEGLLQLAMLAFILSRVGKEYYAAALLILSIQETIELARGGMQKATVKYIAEFNAKGLYRGASEVFSSSAVLQGAVGILGFLVCATVAPHAAGLLAIPSSMQSEASWATIVLGSGMAVTLFLTPWYNAVAASERYDLLSAVRVAGKLFRAMLVVVLLLLNAPSLVSLVSATVVGSIVERLLCIFAVKRVNRVLKFDFAYISFEKTKIMFSFAFFDLFHTLSGFLYSQGALYIAAHFISLSAVAALGIIGNITSMIEMVMSQFAQMLVPIVSRLQAEGAHELVRRIVTRGTNLTVFAGGVIMAGMIPWMKPFLTVWLGAPYAILSTASIILMWAMFLVNSLTCIHNSLAGAGKVAVDGVSNTICSSLGLIVGTVLAYLFGLGLIGLVVGLLFARLSRFVFISWYGSKLFKISYGSLMWDGYLRPYLLITGISFGAIVLNIHISSWPSVIAAGGTTAIVFFIVGYFWIVDKEIRDHFIRTLLRSVIYLGKKISVKASQI